jgi:hypothetical protein
MRSKKIQHKFVQNYKILLICAKQNLQYASTNAAVSLVYFSLTGSVTSG